MWTDQWGKHFIQVLVCHSLTGRWSYYKSCFNLFQFSVIHFAPSYRPFEQIVKIISWQTPGMHLNCALFLSLSVFSVAQTTNRQFCYLTDNSFKTCKMYSSKFLAAFKVFRILQTRGLFRKNTWHSRPWRLTQSWRFNLVSYMKELLLN